MDKSSIRLDIQERASLLEEKLELDKKLTEAKNQLTEAKRLRGRTGHFMQPMAYRKLEATVSALSERSSGIAAALSILKKKQKEYNIKNNADIPRLFREAARKVLDAELFDEIEEEARQENARIHGLSEDDA
jgi:hypothetical protein